jgi:phosphonate transport system substrate-binding protein
MKIPALRVALAAVLTAVPALSWSLGAPEGDRPQQPPLTLTFGVYQTDKATVMYRMFTPLLEALQADVEARLSRSVEIQLSIFKSYDDGIEALSTGRVDFMHCGPSSYITASERNPKLELLAMEHKDGEKRFKGVIVVQKGSPIQRIEDLRGKRFAFGDPNSTIGRFLVQSELVRHGIHAADLSSFRHLERHDQVAAAVEHGDFDAGSVKEGTFKKFEARGALRALATFDNVTKPVVARAGLDAAVARALREALIGLKDAKLLEPLSISGFLPTSDEEFDFVRKGMKLAERFGAGTSG